MVRSGEVNKPPVFTPSKAEARGHSPPPADRAIPRSTTGSQSHPESVVLSGDPLTSLLISRHQRRNLSTLAKTILTQKLFGAQPRHATAPAALQSTRLGAGPPIS